MPIVCTFSFRMGNSIGCIVAIIVYLTTIVGGMFLNGTIPLFYELVMVRVLVLLLLLLLLRTAALKKRVVHVPMCCCCCVASDETLLYNVNCSVST